MAREVLPFAARVQAHPWLQAVILCCLSLAMVAGAWFINPRGRRVRLGILLLAACCSLRCLAWQAGATWMWLRQVCATAAHPAVAGLAAGLPAVLLWTAEAWVLGCLGVRCIREVRPLGRQPVALPGDVSVWPAVDVLIRAGQQSIEAIRTTVLAARQMDWPVNRLNVYVLEAQHREAVRSFCAEVGCSYLAGEGCSEATPPRWALERFASPYLALLRTDHVPVRSFLQVTMGSMVQDRELAVMQTAQPVAAASQDHGGGSTTRWNGLQDGLDFWGLADYAGTAAIVRRAAWSVVEAAHLATGGVRGRTFRKGGWRTGFLRAPQVADAGVEAEAEAVQKVDERRASWPYVVFLLAPAVFLLFGCVVLPEPLPEFVSLAAPMLASVLVAGSLLASSVPVRARSRVHEGERDVAGLTSWRFSWMAGELRAGWLVKALAAVNGMAIVSGAVQLTMLVHRTTNGSDRAHLAMLSLHTAWAALNVLVLGAALRESYPLHQRRRRVVRVPLHAPVSVRRAGGVELQGMTGDASRGGALLVLERDWEVERGEAVMVTLRQPEGEVALPATVVAGNGRELHVRFETVPLSDEETLTKLLYGPADSWLSTAEVSAQRDQSWFAAACSGYRLAWCELARGSETRTIRRRARALGLCFLCLLMATLAGQREARAHRPEAELQPNQQGRVRSTQSPKLRLMGLGGPLLLQGDGGHAERSFSTPVTDVLQRAHLLLSYRCGGEGKSGMLLISLNGVAVRRVALKGCDEGQGAVASPSGGFSGSLPVELPPELLVMSNELRFTLLGGTPCSGQRCPTMWLRVEPGTVLQTQGVPLRARARDTQHGPVLAAAGTSRRSYTSPVLSLFVCLLACGVLVWPLDLLLEWRAKARLRAGGAIAL